MYDTEKSTYNYIKVDKSCQMKYMKMHQNIRSECYCNLLSFCVRFVSQRALGNTLNKRHSVVLPLPSCVYMIVLGHMVAPDSVTCVEWMPNRSTQRYSWPNAQHPCSSAGSG